MFSPKCKWLLNVTAAAYLNLLILYHYLVTNDNMPILAAAIYEEKLGKYKVLAHIVIHYIIW